MKKAVLNLIIMTLIMNGISIGQTFEENNPFAYYAMIDAVKDFTQHELLSKEKYRVLTMKIIEIRKNSGEFVLSFIRNYNAYNPLNPSHYLYVDNRLVLIKIDSDMVKILDDYGIPPTSDSIKEVAGKKLAGTDPSVPGLHMSITGQIPPKMVVKYRKDKVKKVFYDGRDLPKRKYWF